MEVKKIEEFNKGDIVKLVNDDDSLSEDTYIVIGYWKIVDSYLLDNFYNAKKQCLLKKGSLATDDF